MMDVTNQLLQEMNGLGVSLLLLTLCDISTCTVMRKPVFRNSERLYDLCSENKGADQLRSYCAADLRLWFRI